MKDKISLTLDEETVRLLEKEMKRNNYFNMSKFVNFFIRTYLEDNERKLFLMEKTRDEMIRNFQFFNSEVLRLQKVVEIEKQAQEQKDLLSSVSPDTLK